MLSVTYKMGSSVGVQEETPCTYKALTPQGAQCSPRRTLGFWKVELLCSMTSARKTAGTLSFGLQDSCQYTKY